MHVQAYLRASTDEQDAKRAKESIRIFAKDHGVRVAAWHIENESGATLERPVLMTLLEDMEAGDVLLLEQVDRLARLNATDWETLKERISSKRVRIVSLDLPTSWLALDPKNDRDSIMGRMLEAINTMMLDMLAAIARKDYEDRRRRAAEGIAKAKVEGKYKGRAVDFKKRERVKKLLVNGLSWSEIVEALDCSKGTISAVASGMTSAEQATRGASINARHP